MIGAVTRDRARCGECRRTADRAGPASWSSRRCGAAVERLDDEQMRRIAAYQLGWSTPTASPVEGGGGKAIRPTLAVLSAEAGGGSAGRRRPGRGRGRAGAQLLAAARRHHGRRPRAPAPPDRLGRLRRGPGHPGRHGDADRGRRQRWSPTARPAQRALPLLLASTQLLISGQSRDLALEERAERHRRRGACRWRPARPPRCWPARPRSARWPSAPRPRSSTGWPRSATTSAWASSSSTTCSASSATRRSPASRRRPTCGPASAARRSWPRSTPAAPRRTAGRAAAPTGPPSTEADVALATDLIDAAGGIDWAATEARAAARPGDRPAGRAAICPPRAAAELVALGRYIVERDR